MRKLTRRQARRIAVRAQALDADRPRGLLELAEQLTLLQLDPTAVVAPNADLVAWSRLGSSYRPEHLTSAVATERTMFEHQSKDPENRPFVAMARPMSRVDLHLADMRARRRAPGRVNDWLAANAGFRRRVLSQLRREGPLLSRDIPDTADVPWQSTGWTDGKNVSQILEFLAARGHVAVAGRDGKQRIWDVAERVYPPDVEIVPAREARHLRNKLRLRSLGVARPGIVGDAGAPAEIEGVPGEWRVDPDAIDSGWSGRTALLSPFDRLIYDKAQAMDLFDFEFFIELYKPRDERRWGYFVMPVLHLDRLVGKLDIAADRDEGALVVHGAHEDAPWSKAIRIAVSRELRSLAAWLGLDGARLP